MNKPLGRPYTNGARDAEIEQLFRLGYTATLLAKKYGMSNTNVGRVLKLRGVHRSEGGHSEQCRLYALARRDHRFFTKNGIPPHRIGTIDEAKLALKKYRQQRTASRRRGIEWCLTFREWWGVWDASGLWSLRGRKNGSSTMMTRIGDVGPYAVANVRIGTMVDNIKESWVSAPNRFNHRRKSMVVAAASA